MIHWKIYIYTFNIHQSIKKYIGWSNKNYNFNDTLEKIYFTHSTDTINKKNITLMIH